MTLLFYSELVTMFALQWASISILKVCMDFLIRFDERLQRLSGKLIAKSKSSGQVDRKCSIIIAHTYNLVRVNEPKRNWDMVFWLHRSCTEIPILFPQLCSFKNSSLICLHEAKLLLFDYKLRIFLKNFF